MTPDAPVRNFKLPKFGEDGFTRWVLEGERGIREGEGERIRVEGMALRVYSGDERMAMEMELRSPEAVIETGESRAHSEAPIRIEGAHFEIAGEGWSWSGDSRAVEVRDAVEVSFTEPMGERFLRGAPGEEDGPQRTVIKSDRLKLRTTEEAYVFDFGGSVRAVSAGLRVTGGALTVRADAPKGEAFAPEGMGRGDLRAVRRIEAREDVVIRRAGWTVRSAEALFRPREREAEFSGTPEIEGDGVFLSGRQVESAEGRVRVTGGGDAGRAQMIVSRAGGLGLYGGDKLTTETILLADTIEMRTGETENRFDFDGSVEVMSGPLRLVADRMDVVSAASGTGKPSSDTANAEGGPSVGAVRRLTAEGGVRIERGDQVARGERVVFTPGEQRAELTGEPILADGSVEVSGSAMRLAPGGAEVLSGEAGPVRVRLPQLPDLGYQIAEEGASATGEMRPTVVEADRLRMVEEPVQTVFRFIRDVTVRATNLEAECREMTVRARPAGGGTEAGRGGMAAGLAVSEILGEGDVRIRQSGREATADRTRIRPAEGTLVLEGNAVVEDARGTVRGHRMTLNRGQRKAKVEGGGPDGERARITLPEVSGDGF